MRKIEALINPYRLDDVKHALAVLGVKGLTASEVRGHGRRQSGREASHRGSEDGTALLPKVKIEVVVADAHAAQVIDVVKEALWTGRIGDGKIFVSRVERTVHIRTGERGDGLL